MFDESREKCRPLVTLMTICFLSGLMPGSPASAAEGDGPAMAPSHEKAINFNLAPDDPILQHSREMIRRGRNVFRYDTLGSHVFFGRRLRLHEAIETLRPVDALGLGLKVDAENLPPALLEALIQGQVDLEDPANTVALILEGAVVGVAGQAGEDGGLTGVGITCAFCHSTVDDSVAPGVGRRLDGWANRDLDVGAIVATAPNLRPFTQLLGVDDATVRLVLRSWGPGKFDAHLNIDGQAFRPDGESAAVLIPPAFGLAGVNLATYTGWGSVPYWNAFVGNLEMNGSGVLFDPRLSDEEKFPLLGGATTFAKDPDLVSSILAPLHFFQLALPAPTPPPGSFDAEAAQRGNVLFNGTATCATCHVPPLYTEPGHQLHTADEMGIDDFQAQRSPTGAYRTTPLKGLWSHEKGGFYHDGRFATLREVLDHYDQLWGLGLTDSEKGDLEQFLRSL